MGNEEPIPGRKVLEKEFEWHQMKLKGPKNIAKQTEAKQHWINTETKRIETMVEKLEMQENIKIRKEALRVALEENEKLRTDLAQEGESVDKNKSHVLSPEYLEEVRNLQSPEKGSRQRLRRLPGSRASCAGDAGLRSPSALQARLMQQPRSHGGTESEAHGQRKSRPPLQRSIWQRFWTGSKTTSISRGSEELAAMQAKAEQAWEADKLAKRQARTPEVAVQSAFSPLQSHKTAMPKSQTKITELEAAAKQAA